jgi:four helix bundle protein
MASAPIGAMAVRRLEDLIAYQLSETFKREIYALVRRHPAAQKDFRFRDQLFQAASGPPSHLAEGFGRRTPRDFILFLSYARGSLSEALTRLTDGVDRGHYTDEDARAAATLGRRAAAAVAALQRSLEKW